MKFQDSSFNGLKVTVGTKSVTHQRTHPPTHAPKAICPINFFKVGGIKKNNLRRWLGMVGPRCRPIRVCLSLQCRDYNTGTVISVILFFLVCTN